MSPERSVKDVFGPYKGKSGGEGGIRTPGTGFSQYNGLANRRLQPLGHLSGVCAGHNCSASKDFTTALGQAMFVHEPVR